MVGPEDIREQFIHFKRQVSPGYANFPGALKEFYGTFTKVADICNELGATAEDFVQAQFDNIPAEKLWVNYLLNARCKEYYLALKSQRERVLENELDYWLYYLRCGVKAGQTVEQVLNNDYTKLPAWFRIVCTVKPDPQIIQKYKSRARAELTAPLKAYLLEKKQPIERIIN